jgi:hypothetical protein
MKPGSSSVWKRGAAGRAACCGAGVGGSMRADRDAGGCSAFIRTSLLRTWSAIASS